MGNIYTQLSLEEWAMIHTQLERGINSAAIAMGLNRSASTLSRELRPNGWVRPKAQRGSGQPPVAGGDHACTVTPREERRLRPGTALWNQATRYLKAGYSPEQMAGTLGRVHADTPSLQVSHETLDTAIYAMPHGKWRTDVIGWLPPRPCQTAPACAS